MHWTIDIVELHHALRRIPSLVLVAGRLEDVLLELPAHLVSHGVDITSPCSLRIIVNAEDEAFAPPTRPQLVPEPF